MQQHNGGRRHAMYIHGIRVTYRREQERAKSRGGGVHGQVRATSNFRSAKTWSKILRVRIDSARAIPLRDSAWIEDQSSPSGKKQRAKAWCRDTTIVRNAALRQHMCICVCMCVYVCICIYVYICICICIYTYIYIYILQTDVPRAAWHKSLLWSNV